MNTNILTKAFGTLYKQACPPPSIKKASITVTDSTKLSSTTQYFFKPVSIVNDIEDSFYVSEIDFHPIKDESLIIGYNPHQNKIVLLTEHDFNLCSTSQLKSFFQYRNVTQLLSLEDVKSTQTLTVLHVKPYSDSQISYYKHKMGNTLSCLLGAVTTAAATSLGQLISSIEITNDTKPYLGNLLPLVTAFSLFLGSEFSRSQQLTSIAFACKAAIFTMSACSSSIITKRLTNFIGLSMLAKSFIPSRSLATMAQLFTASSLIYSQISQDLYDSRSNLNNIPIIIGTLSGAVMFKNIFNGSMLKGLISNNDVLEFQDLCTRVVKHAIR